MLPSVCQLTERSPKLASSSSLLSLERIRGWARSPGEHEAERCHRKVSVSGQEMATVGLEWGPWCPPSLPPQSLPVPRLLCVVAAFTSSLPHLKRCIFDGSLFSSAQISQLTPKLTFSYSI